MKIKGSLIVVGTGNTLSRFHNERNCTLTIDTEFVRSASAARGTANQQKIKGWSIEAQLLVNSNSTHLAELTSLISSMSYGSQPVIHFRAPYTGGKYFHLKGQAIVTRLSLSGQGRGLVSVNFTAVGNGRPTITKTTSAT